MDEHVTVLRRGCVTVVCLRGDLDLSVAGHLRETLARVDVHGASGVVLDAGTLEFLDCAAFGAIARLLAACAVAEVPVIVARPTPIVERILSVHGADLPVLASLADAIALVTPLHDARAAALSR